MHTCHMVCVCVSHKHTQTHTHIHAMGFPGGSGKEYSSGKDSACSVGDLGSIPGLGTSGGGKGYPLQYFGLKSSMDCIIHGVTKSWTRLSDFHFLHIHAIWCVWLYHMNIHLYTCNMVCVYIYITYKIYRENIVCKYHIYIYTCNMVCAYFTYVYIYTHVYISYIHTI